MSKRVSSNGGSQGAPKEKNIFSFNHFQATSRMCNNTSSNEKSQVAPKKNSTVYVRRMVEEVFPVEIDLHVPVKRLKEEIQKKKGIEMGNQLVDFAGVSLKDDQPLSTYGIQDSSHLHVMEKTRSRGWITIFVKTPKETFPISLCAQCRLQNLQQKLFDLQGVDVKQQRIMFDGQLQTDPTVKLETFGHGSTVELHLPKVTNVTVLNSNDEKKYRIRIDDFDTGHSVKMTLFRLLRIIPSAQRILIDGVLLEDDVLMRDYELTEKSILNLHENKDAGKAIEVIVKLPSEKEIAVKTDRLKSVYSLMMHIEEIERIPFNSQKLYLKERELLDWKSLGESSVISGSKINLILASTKTQIFVLNVADGSHGSYSLTVDLNDFVSTVKDKMGPKTGIPVDAQRLIYNGRQLEDGRTLASCGVDKGSTLHLVMRLRGC